MFTIQAAREEANRFRELLEKCDPSTTYLIPHGFPVMSCKLCSMLLSFHFLKLWPDLELKGVSGATGKNGAITHYWLEVGDYVIDITGDQYNVISTSKLNEAIVKNRPFLPVHVAHRKDSYLYILFKEGANKQVISSQADSLIKISRIWADFFPANTSNQPI